MTSYNMEVFLEMRGIEQNNACPACSGIGKRTYANTTSWRGGIGGQMMTTDICDKFWGSGDRTHIWLNLRVLTAGCLCKPCNEFLRSALRKAVMGEGL